MHFRSHLLASALVGAALYPRSPRKAALLTIGGVLIDIDHYVLYALRSGDWNPFGALRYNARRSVPPRPGDTRPRYGALRSDLHRKRVTLPLLWLVQHRWPTLRPFALGVTLHLLLDMPWLLMFDYRVWRRAHGCCERCGSSGVPLGVHYVRLPQHGGDLWALENRALWCEPCAKKMREGM